MSFGWNWIRSGLALSAFLGASAAIMPIESAGAVVYCRAVGIPRGCVARPAVAPRVVGAPRVGARAAVRRPGVPGNRGGPVNRVGRF